MFSCEFCKFLRAPFLLNSSGKLLLWLILIYGIENNRGNISLKPWKLLMKYVVSLHYCKTDTGKDFITPNFTREKFSTFLFGGKIFHHFGDLEILLVETVVLKIFLWIFAKFFGASILQNTCERLLSLWRVINRNKKLQTHFLLWFIKFCDPVFS